MPLRRVEERTTPRSMDRSVWPATLALVRRILDEGLDLGRVTVLVGDNGAGKSTPVEAIAIAFGLNPEGGSTGAMNQTRSSESSLADHLQLVRGGGASKEGYFLRAETMHGFFTYLGSFLDLVMARSRVRGLWCSMIWLVSCDCHTAVDAEGGHGPRLRKQAKSG